jgi:hypothetical protein
LAAVALLLLTGVVHIVLTYRSTSQGFDEPCHVAAGIEWLAKGTYTLDPVHPPLSRDAIGLPLYLAGERFPKFSSGDPRIHNYNDVGNSILYGDGHYLRNLSLARSGVLPFFILEALLVFLWAREEFGDFAALAAAALVSSLPIILAFSGLAYSDVPASCMQFGSLFAFVRWLKKPIWKSTWLLGVFSGLALLSKLTTLLFLPASAFAILFCKWFIGRRPNKAARSKWLLQTIAVGAIAMAVFWAGYGFSMGPVRESMQLSPGAMPSFQHFPPIVGRVARSAVRSDWDIPVPAFVEGFAEAWSLNKTSPPAYLLGRVKNGGWWYFFMVAAAVKTPLAFLILCALGLVPISRMARQGRWEVLAPAASAVAILIVTMPVTYDAGLRHVLVIFPLLAVVAGCGASFLWHLRGSLRIGGRVLLLGLLLWQGVSSFRAHADYLAYFNELAGSDPSKILVTGCDLDCGQDVFRLSKELQRRNIQHFSLAIWSSADLSKMDLPDFEVLQPFKPVTGWVAISARSLRFGDVLHNTYPPGAFGWLDRYQPIAQVGKTIRLYYIPEP